jgi:protease I
MGDFMKILMVIAKDGFRDEEFQIPFKHFQDNKYSVDVASTAKGDCFGKLGAVVAADRSFEDIEIEEYMAVVLVGGPGAPGLVGNKALEAVIHQAVERNIVLAAICISPIILANAGVLEDKRVTVWNEDGNQSPIMFKAGAVFVDEPVVADGRLITGNGPDAAQEFAEAIVKELECDDCHIK